SRDKALLLMRVVIAAEETLASTQKEYGNLTDVIQSPAFPDASGRTQVGLPAAMDVVDSSSAQIGNYLVRITTSEDKKHFQASLEPNDPKTCGPALFGDDREFIYGGKVLGCPSSGPLR
ncbi:MAG TPA: hypothetical protein VGI56_16185, partial [Galbitalea sp.]